MKRTDAEDAVARALDLLPTDDPARSDPRLVRDPSLAEEARLTREAAADVWLAVSPLRAAPPDVLHSVLEHIAATSKPAAPAKRTHLLVWTAAAGWAAAAVVTFLLWPRGSLVPQADSTVVEVPGKTSLPAPRPEAGGAPTKSHGRPDAEDRRLRRDLLRMRETVSRPTGLRPDAAPRVMRLSAPGAQQSTAEETRQRVHAVLTNALLASLESESALPGDLVIERGWLPAGATVPDDGTVLRHRNFPEDAWEDLGLMRSDERHYFDPVHEVMWVPDETGRGFVGTRTKESDLDLSEFKTQKAEEEVEAEEMAARRVEPEGFVIEDPVTKAADVVIDQVPVPQAGMKQMIVWTDVNGGRGEVELSALNHGVQGATTNGGTTSTFNGGGLQPLTVAPMSIGSSSGGTFVISTSLGNRASLASFQLLEVSAVANGTAPRIIVASGK